jgi:hypothetical protein
MTQHLFSSTGKALGLLLLVYLALLIPDRDPSVFVRTAPSAKSPFAWNQDPFWEQLEASFVTARGIDSAVRMAAIQTSLQNLSREVDRCDAESLSPSDSIFRRIEGIVFRVSPLVAVTPSRFISYAGELLWMRDAVKRQAQQWDMNNQEARTTLYRLLYGSRSALEEVMLQLPREEMLPLMAGVDEPSACPAASVLGVRLRSGDILLSRGGAPTSALIARGNDFPGYFSHVALVHVDGATGSLTLVESHIERGVTLSTPGDYLHDRKLRMLVLRLRHDLPAVRKDPLLPHRAAGDALAAARSAHIPYDFAMDHRDTTALFCSEVASRPYRKLGVELWSGLSHISTPGLQRWLAGFGVRNFVTQQPSDLEYDPQLRIVAEWRDTGKLQKDHIDDAVTEAMLEGAERGDELAYAWYELPVARLVRWYSMILNVFGEIGPIPEGMSATSGLRHRTYAARHGAAVDRVKNDVIQFVREHGYQPPYWRLLAMARKTLGG